MEDEKNRIIKWVKEHKQQFITIGISVPALILCL